ncbi:diguanylate cyclase (GGDEF)-like protein [Inhella inkyongensis]|uniref:diguanylate cyclase n=1 Tax=Inhella inkyongensis TaxID=392593 RepID=A0A840S8Y9_9BURK|nr:ligand-binding sensor domain-containing diguanylate cyclase [Inhella inkyongensis]MBB5204879.1 diguanylate cyclase (GGDEF)-like protein [Inhella inkyongensis]
MPLPARLLLLFLLALSGLSATANSLLPQFSSVPVPRSVVGGLAQDRAGYLWIGTGNGLARWDGYRLQPMEREGASAIERNLGWVRAMVAARDGRLWIGTEADGLAVYEPERDRIEMRGGPRAIVRALAEDRTGTIWIGTAGEGLWQYSPQQQRFQAQPLPGKLATETRVLALLAARDGRLWVGHGQGLSHSETGHPSQPDLQTLPLPETVGAVQALLEDHLGRIWIGCASGALGLWQDGQLRWLLQPDGQAVHALAQAADGSVWVGRSQGLDRFAADTTPILPRLPQGRGRPGALAGEQVTALLRDQAGAIWVGGYGLGLQRHQPNPALAVRSADADPRSPWAEADARALLALEDGGLLVTTHAGTLLRMDESLRVRATLLGREGGAVEAMTLGPDGSLWLGRGGQLEQHRLDGGLIRAWSLAGVRVYRLRAGRDGTIWAATEDGLFRHAPQQGGAPQRLLLPDGQPLRGRVTALCEDGEGGWWVGGAQGLLRQRAGQAALQWVPQAPGAGLGFPAVLGLLRTAEGQLWVDTPVAGLHRLQGFNAQGQARFERISERHGRTGQPFGANLHADAQGRIWSPMFVYDPKADRLDEVDAAGSAPFGTPWFYVDAELRDGRLVFGGSQGLLVVRPERYSPSIYAPPLVINGLRVDGQPQHLPNLRQGLVLAAGTRSFGLDYAALDFAAPQRLRYRHRLVGLDPAWIEGGADFRMPSYSNLAPGRYTLHLNASNHDGVWSPKVLELPIEVRAAWWQRPTVRALGLILALLGLWSLLQWRTRQLRRREGRLQALVQERTAELRRVSLMDPLTGAHNRRYMAQHVDAELQQCLSQRRGPAGEAADLCVMLLDIDHFKQVNDRHGHAAGDAVLVQAAERLRAELQPGDCLVRWGGEEFLLLTRPGSRAGAIPLAERLCEALRQQDFQLPDGQALAVRASIGLACYPLDPQQVQAWDWKATLQLADAALYAAKAAGRDGWVACLSAHGLQPTDAPARDWLTQQGLLTVRSTPVADKPPAPEI